MKYLIIALAFFITGCVTPPVVKPAFPEPPSLLMRTPADLDLIQYKP